MARLVLSVETAACYNVNSEQVQNIARAYERAMQRTISMITSAMKTHRIIRTNTLVQYWVA